MPSLYADSEKNLLIWPKELISLRSEDDKLKVPPLGASRYGNGLVSSQTQCFKAGEKRRKIIFNKDALNSAIEACGTVASSVLLTYVAQNDFDGAMKVISAFRDEHEASTDTNSDTNIKYLGRGTLQCPEAGCYHSFESKYVDWFPHEKYPLWTNKVWTIQDCRMKCHPVFNEENALIQQGKMTEHDRTIPPFFLVRGARGNKGKMIEKKFDSDYLSRVLFQFKKSVNEHYVKHHSDLDEWIDMAYVAKDLEGIKDERKKKHMSMRDANDHLSRCKIPKFQPLSDLPDNNEDSSANL